MADVNMNAAQEVGQVPLNVQAYIRSLEAQVTAAQAGQNMGQQRVKPSKPTRFNGAMGSDPLCGSVVNHPLDAVSRTLQV